MIHELRKESSDPNPLAYEWVEIRGSGSVQGGYVAFCFLVLANVRGIQVHMNRMKNEHFHAWNGEMWLREPTGVSLAHLIIVRPKIEHAKK